MNLIYNEPVLQNETKIRRSKTNIKKVNRKNVDINCNLTHTSIKETLGIVTKIFRE